MHNIKCIVADCDGTILNSKGEIDPTLYSTIKILAEQGILFTLASGRSLHLMFDIVSALDIRIPYIADNGSSIYMYDEVISQSYISNKYIEYVKNSLMQERVPFIIYGKEMIASYHGLPELDYFKHHIHPPKKLISLQDDEDFREWHQIYKIVIDASNINHIGHIITNIKKQCPNMRLEKSEDPLYTCTSLESSKGHGINKVANLLHISPKSTLVFGDNFNDLSMFHCAGKAVAMNNSAPEIKACAHETCQSNDEQGVSKYLLKMFAQNHVK